jgi:hypothetical protein
LPAIKAFADDMLRPLVHAHVSEKAGDAFAQGNFKLDEWRMVRFWDTKACILEKHGFAFRERADLDQQGKEPKERELTLKFRVGDLFLAAETPLPVAQHATCETKLEEDVMPLAVRTGEGSAVVANPPSTRSHFSRSTKQPITAGQFPGSMKDLADLYPTLCDSLKASGAEVDPSDKLVPGEAFSELVFKSPEFKLGDDVATKFSLVLWYPRPGGNKQPALAEISFKYETARGGVPRKAAQRALNLLRAMQGLPWAKPEALTKTALASPPPGSG